MYSPTLSASIPRIGKGKSVRTRLRAASTASRLRCMRVRHSVHPVAISVSESREQVPPRCRYHKGLRDPPPKSRVGSRSTPRTCGSGFVASAACPLWLWRDHPDHGCAGIATGDPPLPHLFWAEAMQHPIFGGVMQRPCGNTCQACSRS